MADRTFYLTTPIYYVNARPHLGHACTTIMADAMCRYRRLRGERVYLLTGTDEHGDRIAQVAAAAGVTPQAYADEIRPGDGVWLEPCEAVDTRGMRMPIDLDPAQETVLASALREAVTNVVRHARAGRERIWELDPKRLDDASRWLEQVSKRWDEALGRLKRFVEGDA